MCAVDLETDTSDKGIHTNKQRGTLVQRDIYKTEELTMKKINAFVNQAKDINPTAFWAYRRSEDAGNDLIDFSEVIWDEDIDPIAETFRENDITEFTISSTFSGLIPTLAAFERHGFKMAGITEVNATYTDWQTGKRARIPAIRMVRG